MERLNFALNLLINIESPFLLFIVAKFAIHLVRHFSNCMKKIIVVNQPETWKLHLENIQI